MTDHAIAVLVAPLQRLLDRIANLAIGIAAAALLGLVLVQGWQVFTRYVLNDSPSWTEPVTLLLLSTAMSLAAAAGVHTRRHFGFFLLAEKMHAHVRRAIDLIRPLVIAAIGAVIAWWGAVLLLDGLYIKMAGARLPQSINYLPLSISGALMSVFALHQAWQALRPATAEGVN
ncbi:C4-dicarboxylate ABC transporter [Xanthomonas translucens pv. arrhenatheri]|uniref:TRAP transporter small permease protein n=1 Tax=Xanthomonas graminis pv. arrhenatheri LMG 727 TaxID=1195923 RepID=A0A0K2ZUT5_9XANT|nr:TRAP transporter small permease [Xanthomonas translucens]OAX67289.1 C4-dicarboxylate ABC transporter [Xanthomonas translucens pv. arrhenatheri]UKE77756.1 TRAP transporter small permease [Xanthomonas translucens pv. arrhenatheri]CTP89521.1 dicarboxylate transport system, small permease component [Xanthomonas translucens pv. arrhenatheri LMG 727]